MLSETGGITSASVAMINRHSVKGMIFFRKILNPRRRMVDTGGEGQQWFNRSVVVNEHIDNVIIEPELFPTTS